MATPQQQLSSSIAALSASIAGLAPGLHPASELVTPTTSIAALRALTGAMFPTVLVRNYDGASTGETQGVYVLDADDSTSPDNDGTIIVAADGGRYKLQIDGGVSLKRFGAKGDGSTDDTRAVLNWIAFVFATGITGYAPAGTYKVTQPVAMDWGPVATTGATFVGDGAAQSVFDLSSVTTSPAWLMTDTTGSDACFYGTFKDIGFIGDVPGPLLQIGNEDYSDAFNEFEIKVQVKNNNTTESACGTELNGLYNCSAFLVSNCHGHGDALRIRQTQFSHIFGSSGNADTAIHLTGGYSYGNTFISHDCEVVNTCVVIDEQNVSQNTWIGGQFVWSNGSGPAVAAINATNGNNNRFVGINLASPGSWTAAGGAVGVLLDNRGVGNYLFGQVTVKPVSGDGDLIVDSVTGNIAQLLFRNNGNSAWGWTRDTSGNLLLIRYNPSTGASIDTPIVIEPSQGVSTFKKASLSGVGFFGAGVSTTRPTVSGAKGGNAALASLIQQLAALGLIADSTTA
ncbi:hypothetical protein FSO04_30820 [Paraburkholderia madseniana]|uniref:Rhamnogalacturonase A/B/Epimerase-like pectate lyase domain-containing protein n=2 Tax=Paraburkholderia madseniana TaxID=2599607 RepID=A0A6N6W804_9BURK|nr:hypothetical protein FSO04_30820 [Paraburkholderia madseniana]